MKQTRTWWLDTDIGHVVEDGYGTQVIALDDVKPLIEALEVYAAEKGNKFETVWEAHVCDSWSGQTVTFDWNGDIQDEPYEAARKALERFKALLEVK